MADAEGIIKEVRNDIAGDPYHLTQEDCLNNACETRFDCWSRRERLSKLDSALALMAVDRELLNVVEEECQKGCPEWLGRVYEAWLARRARLAAQSHAPGPAEQQGKEGR